MKSLLLGVTVLGLMLFAAGRAKASIATGVVHEFSFSYSGTVGGSAVSGSGDLFGTEIGSGDYLLTSGSGTSAEVGVLTLEPAGTWTNMLPHRVELIADNILSPSSNPVLTGNGIVFSGSSLLSTSHYFNIWGNGPNSYTYFNNSGSNQYGSGPVSFTVKDLGPAGAPVPEPTTLIIWSVLGGVGLTVNRWRKRKVA